MKHIFNIGDRVQDSRNPSLKGVVTSTDITDHSDGNESYSLDYANDGFNGWSDWPYQIDWDGVGLSWIDSQYAEPVVEDEHSAQEGTAVADVLTEGTPVYLIRSAKTSDDDELEVGDVVNVFSATIGTPEADPIKPDYYRFPSGAAVIDISRYLTGNGAQVVQYVSRSTRLDGHNKGDVLENLRKARWFLNDEIARLEALDG